MSKQTEQRSDATPRLIPLTQWNDYHIFPTIGGMRHIAFNRKSNGFARAFVHVGRRLVVVEAVFFEVIAELNQTDADDNHWSHKPSSDLNHDS
jgi:hypothetical protein